MPLNYRTGSGSSRFCNVRPSNSREGLQEFQIRTLPEEGLYFGTPFETFGEDSTGDSLKGAYPYASISSPISALHEVSR